MKVCFVCLCACGTAAGGGASAGDGSGARNAASAVVSGMTTLRVHYPNAGSIVIRGGTAPLDWETSTSVTQEDANTFSLTLNASQDFDWKPMLLDDNNWIWSLGANFHARAGQTEDVYPRFFTEAGHYETLWSQFVSYTPGIGPRDILVYYPASYFENTLATYPVVYMHDGQNLFDPETSFAGQTWQVQQTLNAAEEDGSIREVVVIGIDNTDNRIWEYTPTTDPTTPGGGGADAYLHFITQELMPRVNATLRVQTGPGATGIIGSSLGGLLDAYTGIAAPTTFGLVGALSPSTWWNNDWIIGQIAANPQPGPWKMYLDSGNAGDSNDDVSETAQLARSYNNGGYTSGNGNFDYVVQDGGQHSEYYWAQRLPGALQFLFGPVP